MSTDPIVPLADRSVLELMKKYNVSPEFGFLAENPVFQLSSSAKESHRSIYIDYFQMLEYAADNLPKLIRQKQIAKTVAALPLVTSYFFLRYLSAPQQYFLMHLVAILTHGYFNEMLGYTQAGEVQRDTSIKILPAKLARPLWIIAREIKTAPAFSYMLYSLYNYDTPDPTKNIALDNIRLVHSFTGTRDEEWFVNIHQVIEKTGAPAIKQLFEATHIVGSTDAGKQTLDTVTLNLETAAPALEQALAVLKRMREHCNSQTYFESVRKFYIFPKNVVFEGVEELNGKPVSFYGETGGQTPFMHAILSLLGMYPSHISYFPDMRQYMSGPHREFVEYTLAHRNIRAYVDALNKKNHRLIRAYNRLVQFVVDWRAEHLSLAREYIQEYGDTHGTGSTPFGWLEKLHEHAKSFLILSSSPRKSTRKKQ